MSYLTISVPTIPPKISPYISFKLFVLKIKKYSMYADSHV